MKVLNAILISAVLASTLVSQKCSDRIMKIEIDSIERAAQGKKQIWSSPDSNEIVQKLDCEYGTTWDIFFCTKVCELPIGSECVPPSNSALSDETLDVCNQESECVSTGSDPFKPVFTCQPIATGFDDYFNDDSSSSSFFDFFSSH